MRQASPQDSREMRPSIEQLRAVDRAYARIVVNENRERFEAIYRNALNELR